MGFPDLCRLPLSMLLPLLLLLAVAPVYLAQEHVPEVDQQSQEAMSPITEKELEHAIRDALTEYTIIPLPGIPPINIAGDSVSISLSLADIYLQGLNDTDVAFKLITQNTRRAKATVQFQKLSLLVGSYSSSGHVLNLPFNGEGPMYLRLHDLSIVLFFKWSYKFPTTVCAKYNTSAYEFDLRRMETRFENLNQNEGADLGQLVDIVVPSFGQDIVKQLQVLISTKYYQFFDSTIIGLVNRITKCSTASREDILKIDELMKVINDIIKDLLP